MCISNDEQLYQEAPAVTIGGPSGDYELIAPVTSCRWAEYAVVSVANGDGGSGSVVVSGDSAPKALAYDGTVTLNKDNFVRGRAYRVAATTSTPGDPDSYERITHSQKKVFVRIDAANNTSIYVTLKFRMRILDRVPGPSTTVHPDHAHQLNIARADATRQRLGLDKEIAQGEGLNARKQ